jgi:hypothetical protein
VAREVRGEEAVEIEGGGKRKRRNSKRKEDLKRRKTNDFNTKKTRIDKKQK